MDRPDRHKHTRINGDRSDASAQAPTFAAGWRGRLVASCDPNPDDVEDVEVGDDNNEVDEDCDMLGP